ncbi:MAG: fibronectin type III domain-containing protein, partial [Bacteroidales bacterium]|nr:fibronectin type III domain-containing protein [Bacteroidales bacterium]
MLLPFVSQGQTECTPISTFPVTYGFETSEGFPTGVTTAPTTNTLGDCWRNEPIVEAGAASQYNKRWHVATGTNTAHTGTQGLRLPDKTSGNRTMLVFPAMNFTSANGYVVSFWIYRMSAAAQLEGFEVWVNDTDTLGPNADSLGHFSRCMSAPYPDIVSAAGWYQYETDVITRTGTVYLILVGHSYFGAATNLDDLVISESPACAKVSNLAISAATSNSLTLTWSDAVNTGATYNIYDLSDTSLLQAGVTGTTYTVTGLTANTAYSFGVMANCGTDGFSDMKTIDGRTECAPISLPMTWGFETEDLQGSTTLQQIPWCFERYNNSTSTSYNYYPYALSNASNAHGGSTRSMYFYGSASYGADTMALIFPELNVTTYPMNGNRVKFFARGSSDSYTKNLYVGTMSDPTDISTFTLADTVAITGTTYAQYSISLDNAPATDAYVVMIAFKGNGAIYVDDVTLEVKPACMDVAGVTVSATTSNSITLTWTDAQNPAGTTYTIYNMSDTTAVLTNVPSTTGTITGLTANTPYTFGVQANCTAGDAPIYSIDARTACGVIN